MHSKNYAEVSDELLVALSIVPHIILVHEALFAGEVRPTEIANIDELDDGPTEYFRDYFDALDDAIRSQVNIMLAAHNLHPLVYRKNAELSTLASSFIDDQLSNLLFRLYIPSGRLYENESAQLLNLFNEWLRTVRGHNVRQGGYQTNHGRVVEFFADSQNGNRELSNDLQQFRSFIASIEDRESSTLLLQGLGLSEKEAEEIVSRYALRLRRIRVDARHERQRRVLAISQELESELIDTTPRVPLEAISSLVNQLVPMEPALVTEDSPRHIQAGPININNQFINYVEGVVANSINGNISTGTQPAELLEIISTLGGNEQGELHTAIEMVTDTSAPTNIRLGAKQKLKTFLLKVGDQASSVAFSVAQKWVEHQMGL
jgi:hypothetical protein